MVSGRRGGGLGLPLVRQCGRTHWSRRGTECPRVPMPAVVRPAARAGRRRRRLGQEHDEAADDDQGSDADAGDREAVPPTSARLACQSSLTPSAPSAPSAPSGIRRRQRCHVRPRLRRCIAPRRLGLDESRSRGAGPFGRRLVTAGQVLAGVALRRAPVRAAASAEHVGPDQPVRLRSSPSVIRFPGMCQRFASTTSGAITIAFPSRPSRPRKSQCHSSSRRSYFLPESQIPAQPLLPPC